jgi:signal transduction histidine kinase
MSRLIEELLILARAESEPNDGERMDPVRLDEIAGEAIRVGATLAKGQQLDFPFQPELIVRGNRDRLFQVLLILIDNAVRHTPAGGQVAIYLSSELGNAVVRVSDTGSGIPEEHLAHIFERFYRADASRQRTSGGTGLGLAIARAIVEQHKGSIAVTSTVGIGTTMTVTLPLAPQPARLESVSVTEPELVG